nr:hypothetical protein [uncultured Mediterranean phage uvMED]
MMAIMNPKTVDGQHQKNSNGLEVYEWDPVDEAAWQAWARSYGLSRDAGRLQGKPMDKAQAKNDAI